MSQLCLWTKIRTKQWLVLSASAFQCMRADFLCPKCDNLFFVSIPAKIKMSFIWKDDFFLSKSASFVSWSQAHLAKRCSSIYTTIFIRRKDKSKYLSNQTWTKCYHSRNKHSLKKILDGGSFTIQKAFRIISPNGNGIPKWLGYHYLGRENER